LVKGNAFILEWVMLIINGAKPPTHQADKCENRWNNRPRTPGGIRETLQCCTRIENRAVRASGYSGVVTLTPESVCYEHREGALFWLAWHSSMSCLRNSYNSPKGRPKLTKKGRPKLTKALLRQQKDGKKKEGAGGANAAQTQKNC
jgi:hypothetical protein